MGKIKITKILGLGCFFSIIIGIPTVIVISSLFSLVIHRGYKGYVEINSLKSINQKRTVSLRNLSQDEYDIFGEALFQYAVIENNLLSKEIKSNKCPARINTSENFVTHKLIKWTDESHFVTALTLNNQPETTVEQVIDINHLVINCNPFDDPKFDQYKHDAVINE